MTLITPSEGAERLDDEMNRLRRSLLDLTQDLERLNLAVRAGEESAVRDANKLLGEIRHWMRVAAETEARFEDRIKKQQGVVRDYALDFDEARSQIGCRLARLRRAGCPGRVS